MSGKKSGYVVQHVQSTGDITGEADYSEAWPVKGGVIPKQYVGKLSKCHDTFARCMPITDKFPHLRMTGDVYFATGDIVKHCGYKQGVTQHKVGAAGDLYAKKGGPNLKTREITFSPVGQLRDLEVKKGDDKYMIKDKVNTKGSWEKLSQFDEKKAD